MNTFEFPTSPKSPVTPSYPTSDVFDFPEESKASICDVLKRMGYINITKVTDTLQGIIWRATDILHEQVVIKTTDRYLHNHAMAVSRKDGAMVKVDENIGVEQSILKFLTQNETCPESIVKWHKFFETNNHYYLVMEDGGSSLFSFVKKAHSLIKVGKISALHWRKVIKVIWKQMVECIDYIHSKKVCHFDISLENFVINDVEVVISMKDGKEQLKFVLGDIQVKLCDFGLAELFTKIQCRSSKYVGKECYASPEVIANKRHFDAKKNDIWCVGVCLFMMATGFTPFNSATKSDPAFMYIVEYGKLLDVLNRWKVLEYIDADLFDLIESIFQYESYRINLKQIKKHSWLKGH